jgi:hypothetical protein
MNSQSNIAISIVVPLFNLHRFCAMAGLDLFDVLRQRISERGGENAILE